MKIMIVIDETCFFHPQFLCDIIRRLNAADEIVGVGLVTKVLEKSSINAYMKRNVFVLRPAEIIKLGIVTVWLNLKNIWHGNRGPRFYSVKSVLQHFKIPYVTIQKTVN